MSAHLPRLRLWLTALLLLAVFARGMLPAGFMPVFGTPAQHQQIVTLVLCSGAIGKTISLPAKDTAEQSVEHATEQEGQASTCAYALALAPWIEAPAPMPVQLAIADKAPVPAQPVQGFNPFSQFHRYFAQGPPAVA